MLGKILLISIKPEYAKKIFEEKTKLVELRRVRPRHVIEGDIVLVYVSSPEKAFVGWFEVERVMETNASQRELNQFWEEIQTQAGINRQEFLNYYQGASVVVGIFFRNVQVFERRVELECLPEKLSYLRPPQSYRYLNKREYEIIKALGKDNPAIVYDS